MDIKLNLCIGSMAFGSDDINGRTNNTCSADRSIWEPLYPLFNHICAWLSYPCTISRENNRTSVAPYSYDGLSRQLKADAVPPHALSIRGIDSHLVCSHLWNGNIDLFLFLVITDKFLEQGCSPTNRCDFKSGQLFWSINRKILDREFMVQRHGSGSGIRLVTAPREQ